MKRILIPIVSVLAICSVTHAQSGCTGDISGDGQVNGVDLALVLTSWGPCTSGAAISGVFPQSGSTAGGTPIAIVGVDLGATASVTIGGVAVQSFTVVSPTVVTAVTPAGGIGAKTLALRNAQGQQIAAASFAYFTTSLPWGTVLEQLPDPTVVTDAALRTAIVATGLPWRMRDNGTGIEMLLVPPGTFAMGCSPSSVYGCDFPEGPVHPVTLTSPYYMGRFEVTQAQWTAVMGGNPSEFQGSADSPLRPVERVSWNDAVMFLSATALRFPTEAEWERAYRAGTTTAFHSGAGFSDGTNDDALVGAIGWFGPNSAFQTHAVGGKNANSLGLHDMAGNVWEWVQDRFASDYYSSSPAIDPPGPTDGATRVQRGGSRDDRVTMNLRASFRIGRQPTVTGSNLGFRVARNP